jgi:hypothetical protein
MSTSRTHHELDRHLVLTYLDDERLNMLVDQRRRAGERLGAALIWSATVLSKLDRLTADRRPQASLRG